MLRIGVDLGGTNIAAGLVDEEYRILDRLSVKTNLPRPAESIIADIAELVNRLCDRNNVVQRDIESVGVGVPGTVNEDTGYVEFSNNLGFEMVPFISLLGGMVEAPVHFGNDANAAALGEYLAGGYNVKSFVMITLGTGIGSGIILDGKLIKGINYAASELGHTVIKLGGEQCTCGRKGCFEAYSSATGLIRMTKESMAENPDSIMNKMAEERGKVTARTSFDCMRAGDKYAKAVVDKYIKYLAAGITNTINTFQPDILCIGGGVCNEGDPLLLPVKAIVEEEDFANKSEKRTEIVIAKLGNDAGLIGAAFLGRANS